MDPYVLPTIRVALYIVLGLFSVVLLGLTAARIHYTEHLPASDPLNNGHNFYDPIIAELLVCALLAMVWCPLVVHMIHGRNEYRFLSKVWHELVGLSILWIMWLVGAAVATSIWPNLPSFCSHFKACRLLDAILAFAWLGWFITSALVVTMLLQVGASASTGMSLQEPAHGRWTRDTDPRLSTYSAYSSPSQRA